MTTTTANVTVTINNQTITADLATIATLLGIAANTALEPKAKRGAKVEAKTTAKAKKTAKADQVRAKHDAVLDSKRVARMTQTAVNSAAKQGFEVKTSKQGAWMWLYPCGKNSGQGRSDEFKNLKLAKGWTYSIKRGAFHRDFS